MLISSESSQTRRIRRNSMAVRDFLLLIFAMLFLIRSPASAILDPVDFLALQLIKKSLSDSPGSDFFSQWDFTDDPCSFPGIFCAEENVVALVLGDPRAGSPGLSGRIDPAIGRLSGLSELSLVPGRVFGQIPDSISLCSSLRFLALSSNFLSGPIPQSIGSLRHLRTVDLSFNFLSGEIPPSILSLPDLSNLVLSHNRLSGNIPSFNPSSPLLRLDVKHNNLSGELPSFPMSIRYLAASTNHLSGQINEVIPNLTRLAYLDLSTNILTGPIPGSIFELPLSSLRLQRNKFNGVILPPADVRIGEVDLSFNSLTGAVSPFLAAVGRLYLNNNRFTGDLPAKFVERLETAGIEILYLQHNFISGMKLSPATEIPMTTSLCLQYNCMIPPVHAPCPVKAGTQKTRPLSQCPQWRL